MEEDLPLLPIIETPTYGKLFNENTPTLRHDGEPELEPDTMEETKILLKLTYPISITYMLESLPGLVVVILVGHLNSPFAKDYVAAATLSTTITNLTGLSIAFGLLSALDTLFSQAYGAMKFKKLGIYVQSALITVACTFVPIFLLNWHSASLLVLVGQDPEVARLAGEFSRITVFGIPSICLYEILRKLLQTQNVVKPFVAFTIVGNIVNIAGGYYLTYHTSLGFHGAALSRTLGYLIMPIIVLVYISITKHYKNWWPGWNFTEAKNHIPQFLELGIPGMITIAMNWWAWEILTVLAGLLPDAVLAVNVHAVLMGVANQVFMIFVGISVAGNIRVGTALGANLPKKAQRVTQIAIAMSFIGCTICAIAVLSFRHSIPYIFVNNPESIDRAATALLVYIPYEFIDGPNCVVQGIYRGIGKQAMSAKIVAVAFYLIALPLAIYLAFYVPWSVEGLWVGFGTGNATVLVTCGWLLYKSNWITLAHEAKERTDK